MTERRRVRPGSILFLLLLVLCVFTLARNIGAGDGGIAYSQMCQYFREEKVQSFTITGDSLQAKLQDGTVVVCTIGSVETFYSDLDGLVQQQVESGIVKEQSFIHATNWVSALLPYVMGFIALLLIINLMGRMAGGNAAAQDKYACGAYTRHATHQFPFAALGFFEEACSYLGGHASRHFAHGGKQRK